jgi:hypothetical protein
MQLPIGPHGSENSLSLTFAPHADHLFAFIRRGPQRRADLNFGERHGVEREVAQEGCARYGENCQSGVAAL